MDSRRPTQLDRVALMRGRRGWMGAAVGLVIAISFAAIGVAVAASQQGPPPIIYADTIDPSTTPAPPSTSPADVLAAVMARDDFSRIRAVNIGPAPADFLESGYSGIWVYLTVDAPSANGAAPLHGVWEATVVAGAFRDEMHSAGLETPEGYGVLLRLPDGTIEPFMAWPFGDIALGQRFTDPASAAEVQSSIRQAVRSTGLEPITVDSVVAKDLSLVVIASVPDADLLASRSALDELVDDVFGSITTFEGVYLEIQSPSGKPLAVLTRSFRTGDGMSHTALELGIGPIRGLPDGDDQDSEVGGG
jgi:hypothetical protein